MNPILELKDLSKEFENLNNKLIVLKRINLKLFKGQCIGLIGPSGSGKTTLLQIAGLLDNPTNGHVIIKEKNCGVLKEEERNVIRKKHIGFVYQNFFLLNDFSALENVIIPQMINGSNYKTAKNYSIKILKNVGLQNKLYNKPKELSGGEKQRVAICRAIANNPDIILADEPTGNLDSANTKIIMSLIKQLVKKYKISFIIATHNLNLVKNFDKIVKINDGLLK